nr:TetR/AcrR family transcriptional regulator [Lysinibacillus timonensis]
MNNRKRQIINAARKLFIEKGFTDTSIMDIIAAANISKGTFYNHFSAKSECLIAILEESREEANNRRYEVAMNRDPSDMNVLIEQITLLLNVNRERNLVQIFESITGNTDQEIKEVLQKQLLREIDWLANRFVDVFGNEARSISYECAVYAIGMMHQSLRIMSIATGEITSPKTVIATILKNIEYLVPHLLDNHESFFTNDVIQALRHKVEVKPVNKDLLVTQLKGFIENLTEDDSKKGLEYANFLLNELVNPTVNDTIFEAVLSAFNRSYNNSPHEAEAHEISIYMWRYLDYRKTQLDQ